MAEVKLNRCAALGTSHERTAELHPGTAAANEPRSGYPEVRGANPLASKDTLRPVAIPRNLKVARVSRFLLSPTLLLAGTCLAWSGAAVAAQSGKLYSKVGNWEVRNYGKYCAATVGFDGDRGMRIAVASNGASSFAFMGEQAANFKRSKLSFKFNDNPNTFTRDAALYTNQGEDGGAPWIVVADRPDEPSHAGDWATAKSMMFKYRIGSASYTETFDLRGIDKAWEKTWACAGR